MRSYICSNCGDDTYVDMYFTKTIEGYLCPTCAAIRYAETADYDEKESYSKYREREFRTFICESIDDIFEAMREGTSIEGMMDEFIQTDVIDFADWLEYNREKKRAI